MADAISITGVFCGLVLIVAGCSGGSDDSPDTTAVTTTTQPPAPLPPDGTLRIGALIPARDTVIGDALASDVTDAVQRINDAGGVLDREVELEISDEGSTVASAAAGIDLLLDADVDAIIGPSSSIIAVGALDDAVDARVLTCSPTATSIALDEFPDEGLFFRTIAGDSLQAIAIADVAEDTGASQVAIVHIDDAYGRPYATATSAALDDLLLELVDTVAVAVDDDDLRDDAERLVESGAEVAIVLGSAADTTRFLAALGQTDYSGLQAVIVNDAARDLAVQPVLAELPADLRESITGVAPQVVLPDSEDVGPTPFAAQVADCVNLISLAALQARSDAPSVIATQMASVSAGGSLCRSFEQCAMRIDEGLQINYNGPTGVTELGRDGDTVRAVFSLFAIRPDGSDETLPATIQAAR